MGYAKFIKKAHLWTHESLSSGDSMITPIFSGLETLELHDTSLLSGTAGAIIPYLNAPPRNMTIWTEDESQVTEPTANSRDNIWLKHVAATCSKLESLTFELLLDADPGGMVRLFKSMPQLKSLQLGEKMNRALDDAALLEILTLPHLETLSLQYEISHNIIHVLESRSDKHPILPSIQRLDACLLDGAGSAPEKLLRLSRASGSTLVTPVVTGKRARMTVFLYPSVLSKHSKVSLSALSRVSMLPSSTLPH